MQRIGTVESIANGVAVCRAPDADHPDIGTTALTDSLDDIGRVVDVFGPVERPYLAISPADGVHPPELVGQRLYWR
ncbi:H/ACA ribonucleoprotein complex subunit GAR1 [Halococcoides cellulosivorans]|uniref:H/ACA RNA-protein complex protein Gar1 n=1 Tax=Halococcoides cellulosivorans TaxID=1679096 RepID=A0A2R4X144_9EURY|nr:Gar1/Naf1 family protein [Halococcoides cellulosivorans]AWB27505.1 H/ACA RNA-protein complex protein Gar1 [Halococcoides cellulosivorans]